MTKFFGYTYIAILLAANIFVQKDIIIGDIYLNVGTFFYPVLFLITDIIAENNGIKESKRIKNTAIVFLSIFAVLCYLIYLIPSPGYEEINAVLLLTARTSIVGIFVYTISSTVDIWLFEKLKHQKKWVKNNVSTVTAQLVDTVLFYLLIFGFSKRVVSLIAFDFLLKFSLAVMDTPFFYYFTQEKYNTKTQTTI